MSTRHDADPASDPGAEIRLLRECQDRALDREGIPMLLTLVSEVGPMPAVTDERARAEGLQLAHRLDAIRAAIAPTGRDGDMGRVVTVLQAGSYENFGRSEARL